MCRTFADSAIVQCENGSAANFVEAGLLRCVQPREAHADHDLPHSPVSSKLRSQQSGLRCRTVCAGLTCRLRVHARTTRVLCLNRRRVAVRNVRIYSSSPYEFLLAKCGIAASCSGARLVARDQRVSNRRERLFPTACPNRAVDSHTDGLDKPSRLCPGRAHHAAAASSTRTGVQAGQSTIG